MILSRGDKIIEDCKAVGASVSILKPAGWSPADQVIFLGGKGPVIRPAVVRYDTDIQSGDIVRMDALGGTVLAVEMAPEVFKDTVICFKMTGFKTNLVADVLRQVETRDTYTMQMSYTWSVVASGVLGYRTDLGGEQIMLGSGIGPVPLDSEEVLLPASCGAAVGDRLQMAEWVDGAGTVAISGGTVLGTGTNFESALYDGGRVEVTDAEGAVTHAYVSAVDGDTVATITDTGLSVVDGTWRHLAYTSEKYSLDVVKDNKFEGVLSCSMGEDVR